MAGTSKKMQLTLRSPLDRGDFKRKKDREMRHTPKSPLDRGDLKRRKDRKKQHPLRSPLDRGDLKRRITINRIRLSINILN